jgi:hypothetical protein
MKIFVTALGLFYCSVANAQFVFEQPVATTQIVFEQQPVSNKNWSAFLGAIKDDPTLFKMYGQSMTPDQWNGEQTSSKKLNAPVIGVSWQQALAYCQWRSVVATYLHNHAKLATYQTMLRVNASAKTLITYRLPTEKEWKTSASRFPAILRPGTGFRCVYSSKKAA